MDHQYTIKELVSKALVLVCDYTKLLVAKLLSHLLTFLGVKTEALLASVENWQFCTLQSPTCNWSYCGQLSEDCVEKGDNNDCSTNSER